MHTVQCKISKCHYRRHLQVYTGPKRWPCTRDAKDARWLFSVFFAWLVYSSAAGPKLMKMKQLVVDVHEVHRIYIYVCIYIYSIHIQTRVDTQVHIYRLSTSTYINIYKTHNYFCIYVYPYNICTHIYIHIHM